MVEKFIDNEGMQFLQTAGTFEFEVVEAELKDSTTGNKMVVFTMKCDEGSTKVYHVLTPSSKWTYNKLIAAALNLTVEQRRNLELDYETFHNNLIGKHFIADVIEDAYTKVVKKPLDDGTFEESEEVRVSYKIDTTSYKPVEG